MKTRAFEEGGYIYIDGTLIKGWHKCEDKEFFANLNPYSNELDGKGLKWCGKPLDKTIMAKVLALVQHFPRTEVMFCLYYSEDEDSWLVSVPKQKGTPAHVSYSDEDYDPPKGYYFKGTIHTHPNMNAFWSSTDTGDQSKKNGLHVVLGLRDGKYKEHLCSIFYNGKRYDQEDCVEIPNEDELPEVDKEWLSKVEEDYDPHPVKAAVTSTVFPGYDNNQDWEKMYKDYLNRCSAGPRDVKQPRSWYDAKFWDELDKSCSSQADYYNCYELEDVDVATNILDFIEESFYGASADEQLEVIQKWLERLGENALADKVAETRQDNRDEEKLEASDSGDFLLNLPGKEPEYYEPIYC